MAERYLDVVIRARDSMRAGLRSAQESVGSFAARLRSIGSGEDGFAGLVRGGIAFGAAINGAQIATDSALSTVRAMKGDWSGVEDVVRRLPLGIGRIVGGIIDIREELTGAKAAAESMERVQQIMAQGAHRRVLFIREQGRLADELVRAAEREIELANQASEFDRERVAAKHALADAESQVEKARAGGAEEDSLLKMRLAAEARHSLAIREIAKKEAEKRAAEEAAAAKEANETIRRAMEERLRDEDRLSSLLSDVRRKSFALQGRDLDAALEDVREKYRRMARDAKTESERAAIAALESAEIAETRRGRERAIDRVPVSISSVQVTNRFRGIEATEESRNELRALRRIAERDAETARETNRLLAALNSSIAGLKNSSQPIVLGG